MGRYAKPLFVHTTAVCGPLERTRPMKFGFFTMPEHPPIENWTLSYDRDIAAVVEAERLGFDEFWIGEHHTGGFENVPVPEFMIAKASALTHRIRLGTGVVKIGRAHV